MGVFPQRGDLRQHVVLEKLKTMIGLPWLLSGETLQPMQETRARSLSREDPVEKGTATHSSILPGKVPQTEEPDGLQSIESCSRT